MSFPRFFRLAGHQVSKEVLKHCCERLAEQSNIEWNNLPAISKRNLLEKKIELKRFLFFSSEKKALVMAGHVSSENIPKN